MLFLVAPASGVNLSPATLNNGISSPILAASFATFLVTPAIVCLPAALMNGLAANPNALTPTFIGAPSINPPNLPATSPAAPSPVSGVIGSIPACLAITPGIANPASSNAPHAAFPKKSYKEFLSLVSTG